MKKYLSRNVAALGTGLFVLLPFPGVIQAAPRLIGISGFSDGPGLYEINPTNAVTTLLFTPSPVSDTLRSDFLPPMECFISSGAVMPIGLLILLLVLMIPRKVATRTLIIWRR